VLLRTGTARIGEHGSFRPRAPEKA
jgi:hypothetical protein